MLNSNMQALQKTISSWLLDRKELLRLFNCLIEYKIEFDKNRTNILESLNVTLQSFCQSLIDYSSTLHFKIFILLSEIHKFYSTTPILNKYTLNLIIKNTRHMVTFNDKYENEKSINSVKELKVFFDDLDILGKQLAIRLDLEDQLIQEFQLLKSSVGAHKN